MRNSLFVAAITLLIGYACFAFGGVTPREWGFCLVGIALCSLTLWLRGTTRAPAFHPLFTWVLILTPAYVLLQLLPLPLALLNAADPARADLLTGLNGLGFATSGTAPISIAPTVTFAHLERLLSFILIFLMARELSCRMPSRVWLLTVPILVPATFESFIGLAQFTGGAGRATGTYVNPNHFAAFLHMALPLSLMGAVRSIRRRPGELQLPPSRIAMCGVLMTCSATILFSALFSLSRMGFVTILASCLIMLFLGFFGSKTRGAWRIPAALALFAVPCILLMATPGALADRFTVSTDLRTEFWEETIHLFAAYPVFGCGLGTFSSAIQHFRHSAPLQLLEFAHNDYLQLLSELGILGFIPAFMAGCITIASAWRAAFERHRSGSRLLAVACAASLSAIALDSSVDFNFYVPANMLAAAWIAGLAV